MVLMCGTTVLDAVFTVSLQLASHVVDGDEQKQAYESIISAVGAKSIASITKVKLLRRDGAGVLFPCVISRVCLATDLCRCTTRFL